VIISRATEQAVCEGYYTNLTTQNIKANVPTPPQIITISAALAGQTPLHSVTSQVPSPHLKADDGMKCYSLEFHEALHQSEPF
jgi:hypothetical protein